MSDVERWPAWTPTVNTVSLTPRGPLSTGSEARISQPKFGTRTWRVTSVTPGSEFVWETRSAGVRMVATHRVEPRAEGGARVTLEVDSTGWAIALFGWLMAGTGRRFVETEAAGLKRESERAVAG
jgi:hypothetical protein